jgi:hypothetical protein
MGLCPYEATLTDIQARPEEYVAAVCGMLESDFLTLPRGTGFLDYPTFDRAYEALKKATGSFAQFEPAVVLATIRESAAAFIVLRAMLGFSPPEWAYVTSERTGTEIQQGFVRALDRYIRVGGIAPVVFTKRQLERIEAMVRVASDLLREKAPDPGAGRIHRLDKVDTAGGPEAIQSLAELGVPYSMLLYERFLGRPFAGHRDSVSELVGVALEARIEEVLTRAKISFVKTASSISRLACRQSVCSLSKTRSIVAGMLSQLPPSISVSSCPAVQPAYPTKNRTFFSSLCRISHLIWSVSVAKCSPGSTSIWLASLKG